MIPKMKVKKNPQELWTKLGQSSPLFDTTISATYNQVTFWAYRH
jgi:hypothetical protein